MTTDTAMNHLGQCFCSQCGSYHLLTTAGCNTTFKSYPMNAQGLSEWQKEQITFHLDKVKELLEESWS